MSVFYYGILYVLQITSGLNGNLPILIRLFNKLQRLYINSLAILDSEVHSVSRVAFFVCNGWLTAISGNKFSQALHYTDGPGTPCYNGNISSMTWQAGGETTTRGNKFTYDGLNRMLDAVYGEGTSISSNANRFTEMVTGYDKNGNILALQRYGQTGASSYGLIDNLTFTLLPLRPTTTASSSRTP